MIIIRHPLVNEHEDIRDLLYKNGFNHLINSGVHHWQFIAHNNSRPIIEIAIDQAKNCIVGHYGLIPYPFLFDGKSYPGGKIEGSVVHKDYRSSNISQNHPELRNIKIFPQLIEEMKKEIKDRMVDFVFGFPNDRANKPQQNAFHDFTFQASNFVKILNFNKYLKIKFNIQNNILNKGVSSILSFALDRKSPSLVLEYKTDMHTGVPDDIHDLASESLGKNDLISIDRNPDFIRWRYRDNPVKNYSFLSSHHNGTLKGCLVYSISEQGGLINAEVSDLICDLKDTEAVNRLLVNCIEILRRERADIVSFFVNKSRKLQTLFKALSHLGFIERSTIQNAFMYISERISQESNFIYDINNWYITSLFKQY